MKYHIISTPRSGSGTLYHTFKERYSPDIAIEELWSDAKNYNDDLKFSSGVILIKNHYNQLPELERNDYSTFKWLMFEKWYNVRLLRRNFVEQCLSLAISNQIINYDTHAVKNKVIIDNKMLINDVCTIIWRNWVLHAENPYNINFQETYYTEDFNTFKTSKMITPNRNKKHVVANLSKARNLIRKYLTTVGHDLIVINGDELSLK